VQSGGRAPEAELTAIYQPMTGPEQTHQTSAHETAAGQPSAHETTAHQGAKDGTPAAKSTAAKKAAKRKGPSVKARRAAPRYQPELPPAVKNALLASARKPLAKAEFVYRDVAAREGVSWKILAACDWMQCDAHPRYSPVRGEKLGTANPDGTVFHTKSEALSQCAQDLVALAGAVYGTDLTQAVALSVPELANVFAAYRWGGLLRQHNTSAMEFPYSVQGLTDQFLHMRWPKIANPHAPDKPGSRYKRPFGAVPVVLSLDYPAIVLLPSRAENPGEPDGPNPRPAAGTADPATAGPLPGRDGRRRQRRLARPSRSTTRRGQRQLERGPRLTAACSRHQPQLGRKPRPATASRRQRQLERDPRLATAGGQQLPAARPG
jgi:hypothetical protein